MHGISLEGPKEGVFFLFFPQEKRVKLRVCGKTGFRIRVRILWGLISRPVGTVGFIHIYLLVALYFFWGRSWV